MENFGWCKSHTAGTLNKDQLRFDQGPLVNRMFSLVILIPREGHPSISADLRSAGCIKSVVFGLRVALGLRARSGLVKGRPKETLENDTPSLVGQRV